MDRSEQFLRSSFLIGGVADAAVAINWAFIAAGAGTPNIMCGLVGEGATYRFAMYIAALFMIGWSALLFWGWFRPRERRGLLMITAVLLLLSIVIEIAWYRPLLGGSGFAVGIGVRMALIVKFSASYLYSRRAILSRRWRAG